MVGSHKKLKKVIVSVLLIIGAIFAGFPVLWMLACSFKTTAKIFSWPPKLFDESFNFQSYVKVLTDPQKMRFFLNSYIVGG